MIALLCPKPESIAGTNVVILTENRLVREALAKLLKKENGIRVIATDGVVPETIKHVADVKPNVLVLDPTGILPLCAPLILESIRAVPELNVVLIGMEPDATTFLRLVRTGIVGYLLKDASAAEVVAAVRSVSEGKAVCPPLLCRVLFEWFAHQAIPISNLNGRLQLGLSRREMQIVQIISCGCTNKEVAARLCVSEQTVKNHIHRLLHKLGAANRVKALELLQLRGIVGTAGTVEEHPDPDTLDVIPESAHATGL